MAPKGRSVKAKEEVGENGKEKRTRNVKAASYKDLSDSEDEEKVEKTESDESNSSEEKPKKRRGPKRKTTPRRKRKGASESDSEYQSSDGDSDDKPLRKARQPVRSLRASKSTSYKDLSNSEEESDPTAAQAISRKRKHKQQKKDQRDSNVKSEDEASSASEDKSSQLEVSESGKSPAKGDKAEAKQPSEEPDDVSADKKENAEEEGSKEGKELKESPVESKNTEKETLEEDSSARDEFQNSNISGRPEHELSEDDEKVEKPETLPKKRGRPKKGDESDQPAKKTKLNDEPPKLNRTDSDFKSIDFSSNATTSDGKSWNLKISSWNVAGLKALLKKNGLQYVEHEKPDILCLQETKCSEKKLPPEARVEGYHSYWHSGEKEGYAGVALLSKEEPLNVKFGIDIEEFDTDGRVITAEYEKFYLVNAYVPNAGQGLKTLPRRLEWDPAFRAYLKKLDEKKPVILCGDLNVAHSEIDLTNPKTNTKSAGFTPQEREGMTELLKEGFVDSFRHLYPDKTGAYSFWSYFQQARSRNIGWRLDYFILSQRLLPNLCDNVMRNEVYGSDHCPITLFLNI